MKKLLALIFCFIIIPALLLTGAVCIIYNMYFKPTPAEFSFLRGEENICTIEIAYVTFSEESVKTERKCFIEDVEGFVNDLKAVDFYKGISTDSMRAIKESNRITGFVINYTDGSFEVITPYVCINSDFKISSLDEILKADLYGFDTESINNLISKYSSGSGTQV